MTTITTRNNGRKFCFDQAEVLGTGGRRAVLTPDAYYKIPLGERIQILLERKVQFLRAGRVISTRDAIGHR